MQKALITLLLCITFLAALSGSAAADTAVKTAEVQVSLTAYSVDISVCETLAASGYTVTTSRAAETVTSPAFATVVLAGDTVQITFPDIPAGMKLTAAAEGAAPQISGNTVTLPRVQTNVRLAIDLTGTVCVTFYPNGGKEAPYSQDFVINEAAELYPNRFTRVCHTFAGWAKTPDGAVEFKDKALVITETDADLYAVWNAAHTPGKKTMENYTPATTRTIGYYDIAVYCTVCGTELSRDRFVLPKKSSGGGGGSSGGGSSGNTPSSDTPSSDTPSGDTPSSDIPAAENPAADTPSADTPSSDTPAAPEVEQELTQPVSVVTFEQAEEVTAVTLSEDAVGTVTVSHDVSDVPQAAQVTVTTVTIAVAKDGDTSAPCLNVSEVSANSETVTFRQVFKVNADVSAGKVSVIDFKVKLADLSEAGYSTMDVILYHGNADGTYSTPLATTLKSTDGTYAYYSAETDGASPFAVVYMKDKTIDGTGDENGKTLTGANPAGTSSAETPLPAAGLLAGLCAALLLRRK